MRVSRFTLLVAVIALFSVQRAEAVLFDNFDSYADQDAFKIPWPAYAGNADTGVLTSAESSTSPNSVLIPGTLANSERRARRFFTATPSTVDAGDKVVFSFDFKDTTPTAHPHRNYANLHMGTPVATNQLISLGLNNNLLSGAGGGNFYMARILGGDGGAGTSAYFKLNDGGAATLRTSDWVNLKVEIIYDVSGNVGGSGSQSFKFYVNNILAKEVNNVGTVLRNYDNVALGSGLSNANTDVYFDNVSVQFVPIPEPGALSLLGLAGLGMLRRRRA